MLVCYGTGEGQTAKVARRIADAIETRGHEATTVDAADLPSGLDVGNFDAVLVGASIHAGKHQKAVRKFVTENHDMLASKPTGFFQVSLSSADVEGGGEGEAQAAGYVEEFVEATDFHPDRIGLFGGALRFSEYGFLKRLLMKQIAKRTMPDVDTSHDTEFTDWAEVEAFAADFAAFVEGRLGIAPPATQNPRAEE